MSSNGVLRIARLILTHRSAVVLDALAVRAAEALFRAATRLAFFPFRREQNPLPGTGRARGSDRRGRTDLQAYTQLARATIERELRDPPRPVVPRTEWHATPEELRSDRSSFTFSAKGYLFGNARPLHGHGVRRSASSGRTCGRAAGCSTSAAAPAIWRCCWQARATRSATPSSERSSATSSGSASRDDLTRRVSVLDWWDRARAWLAGCRSRRRRARAPGRLPLDPPRSPASCAAIGRGADREHVVRRQRLEPYAPRGLWAGRATPSGGHGSG